MVIAVILERNPEVNFDDRIDVNAVLDTVFKLYKTSSRLPANVTDAQVKDSFYKLKPSGAHGTYSFIAKATCSLLLDNSIQTDAMAESCILM